MPSTSSPRLSQEAEAQIQLLPPSPSDSLEGINLDNESANSKVMCRSQAMSLYTSHFLSTWNARSYEFAAIIFTASAYPDTLAASSIRGLVTTFSMICFSSSVGRWIDHAPNRLTNLLSTITANRLSVILASIAWIFILPVQDSSPQTRTSHLSTGLPSRTPSFPASSSTKNSIFAAVLLLSVLEKLSSNANMMAMERDWVVAVAAPEGMPYALTGLNAAMRRIDLVCKLLAPLFISIVISSAGSVRVGVVVVGAASAVCWGLEWWCAWRVYWQNESLRMAKVVRGVQELDEASRDSRSSSVILRPLKSLERVVRDFEAYFASRVWIPSLALSLLHISVLAYSATFTTFLLNVGFSLNLITIARASGSIVEISSTVVTPIGVNYLGKGHHHHHYFDTDPNIDDEIGAPLISEPQLGSGNTETGLERLGLWGITWQLINLIPVVLVLWALSPQDAGEQNGLLSRILKSATSLSSPTFLALTLFTFLSFSRLGLWIFDLTTQQLSQTLVTPHQRSSFAGVEISFVSFFEFCHHISAIVLSNPDQFKYLATGSLAAVAVSAAMYAGWVWRQRGHLVHWEKVAKGCDCANSRERSRGVRRRSRTSLGLQSFD